MDVIKLVIPIDQHPTNLFNGLTPAELLFWRCYWSGLKARSFLVRPESFHHPSSERDMVKIWIPLLRIHVRISQWIDLLFSRM